MLIIKILLFILLIMIIYLLRMSIKNKKNIWQKIWFLYNNIYRIMISDFYNTSFIKKIDLRIEILSYYKEIILVDNVNDKYNKLLDFNKFILDYYWWKNIIITKLLSDIKNYTNNYYKLINSNIIVLLFIIILLSITLLLMINI